MNRHEFERERTRRLDAMLRSLEVESHELEERCAQLHEAFAEIASDIPLAAEHIPEQIRESLGSEPTSTSRELRAIKSRPATRRA